MDRRGIALFFRSELSFDDKSIKRTSLLADMIVCAEYLHIPHCEFKQLPRSEQMKWHVFASEKSIYLKKQDDKRKREIQEARDNKHNKIEKPGVRNR